MLKDPEEANLKKLPMVNVCFSQLNEMTGMLGKFKHNMKYANEQSSSDYLKKFKHVKWYFTQELVKPLMSAQSVSRDIRYYLSMYTIGGFRYFASINLPILKVFPLEDGVIVKCVYDEKKLKVDLNSPEKDVSYAYITLTKHPLNDLHPLGRIENDHDVADLINTTYDLLYASDTLPVCILFDDSSSELIFATLRTNEKRDLEADYNQQKNFDAYFGKERHKVIPHISSKSELLINTIYADMIETGVKPCQFEIVSSLEENVFIIAAYFDLLRETRFYKCQLDCANNAFNVRYLSKAMNIVKMCPIEFLSQENMTIPKICARQYLKKIVNFEAEIIKGRISNNFNHELLLLDANGALHLYKGEFLLVSFEPGSEVHKGIISKGQHLDDMIIGLSNPKNSRVTVHMTRGQSFRFDFQFKGRLRDFVLQSWLEVMKSILPKDVHSKFLSHLLYLLFNSNYYGQTARISVWKIFTELFLVCLEKNIDDSSHKPSSSASVGRQSAFEKMINSKSGRQLFKDFKPFLANKQKYDEKSHQENFDRSALDLQRLKNLFTKVDLTKFSECSEDLFKVLHLMYEDMKLNIFSTKYISDGRLISFLFLFCLKKGPNKFAYSEYYIREYPDLLKTYEEEYYKYRVDYRCWVNEARQDLAVNKTNSNYVIPKVLSEPLNKVPSIYNWVEKKLYPNQKIYDSDYYCFFETTRKVCRLYEIFNNCEFITSKLHPLLTKAKIEGDPMDVEFGVDYNEFPLFCSSHINNECVSILNKNEYYMMNLNINLFEKIVFCLKDEYMGRDSIKRLPLGISLPIREVLSHDYFKTIYVNNTEEEKRFIKTWPKEIFELIEREDLFYNLQEIKKNNENLDEPPSEFQFSRISNLKLNKALLKRKSTIKLGRTESNVFENNKKGANNQTEEADSQEYIDLIEKEFKSLSLKNKKISENYFINYRFSSDLRYMEVCLMLDSAAPFKLRIDKLEGIDQMTMEELDTAKTLMHEKRVIRQFAKCVGRGALKLGTIHTVPTEKLKIPEICKTGLLPPDNKKIELKDDNMSNQGWADFHNGVATGLQLATEFDPFSNHIKNWILYHRPPQAKDEFGGFLMSMGFHGYLKCFQKIELYQYMKAKHEAYTVGLLLGGAASMIGTADDAFSKALVINISYLHPKNLDIEISTSIQWAALIGEGLLYKGSNFRQVTEMLLSQLGKRPLNSKNTDRESYTLSAGIALGIVNLGSGSELPRMSDLNIDERLIRFIEGGKLMEELPSMKAIGEQEVCSSVKEGSNVNLYVTLPGAIVALALIHLKSNNKQIADRIEVPKTFFALEYSRPSDVLLKVLCKNLIMWDSIEVSKEWMNTQIPEIIRQIYFEKSIENIERLFDSKISIDEIDFANIAMLYTYFLAGALFSIGFRYAGSGNREVFEFLNSYIEKIITMDVTNSNKFQANVAQKFHYGSESKEADSTKQYKWIDKRTYETCLWVSAFAISMVMAGTGDVEWFVTLRRIRKILEKEMHYGFTMAIHMSIGFLFLGSGKYTFSTSNLSIASLLIALYPRFPDSPHDNRYHLQALRHFYVLAIENRLLQSVDIETGELVSVQLDIEYMNSKKNKFVSPTPDIRQVNTPIMLEDMHKITKIHIKDKKYYDFVIEKPEFSQSSEKGSHSVFERASNLVEKPEFTQKSVSKVSIVGPFDINLGQSNKVGWIPKIIYVKKWLPIECENREKALSGKGFSSLAPFEFSKLLAALIDSKFKDDTKNNNDMEDDKEEEEEEDEDEESQMVSAVTVNKLNEVSQILSSITENPVIRKFLETMWEYKSIIYSELEPSILKGIIKSDEKDSNKVLSDLLGTEEYFQIMDLTEELTDELDEGLQKRRMLSKNFYLGILNECFIYNKIEALPLYIRLFNSSVDHKNSLHLTDLINEGKLISLFYKGLYENKFTMKEKSEDDENDDNDEDMEDEVVFPKVTYKPSSETLLKKPFIEELEEVMNLYNKKDDVTNLVDYYIQHEIDYESPVDASFKLHKIFDQIAFHLKYKNYPYVSERQSMEILIETTQGIDKGEIGTEITSLF